MADELQGLRMRLQQLELEQAQLKREKETAERDFGHQRSRFKDLLVRREEELQQQKGMQQAMQESFQKQILNVKDKLNASQNDAQSFQQMAEVLEMSNKVEMEDQLRQHQQELASLRQVLEVSAGETVRQSRDHWITERQQLEMEITKLRSQASTSAPSSQGVTPTTTHRSTLLPTLLKRAATEEASDVAAKAGGDRAGGGNALSDKEVRQLKEKLRDSRVKVKALQRQLDIVTKAPVQEGSKRNGLFGGLFSSSSSDKPASNDMQKDLKTCSRVDLEMFVQALMTQKGALQTENIELRTQMDELHTTQQRVHTGCGAAATTTTTAAACTAVADSVSAPVVDLLTMDDVTAVSHSPLVPLMTPSTTTAAAMTSSSQSSSSAPAAAAAASSLLSGVSTTACPTASTAIGEASPTVAATSSSVTVLHSDSNTSTTALVSFDASADVSSHPSDTSLHSASKPDKAVRCDAVEHHPADAMSLGELSQLSVDSTFGGGAAPALASIERWQSNDSDSLLDLDCGSPVGTLARKRTASANNTSGSGVVSGTQSMASISSAPVTTVTDTALTSGAAMAAVEQPSPLSLSKSSSKASSPSAARPRATTGESTASSTVRMSTPDASASSCETCIQLVTKLTERSVRQGELEDELELLRVRMAVLTSQKEELQNTVDKLSSDLAGFQGIDEQYNAGSDEIRRRLDNYDTEQADSATMCDELRQSFNLLVQDAGTQIDQLRQEQKRINARMSATIDAGTQRESALSKESALCKEACEAEQKAHFTTRSHLQALQKEVETHSVTENELRTEVMLLQNRLQSETFAKEGMEASLQTQLQDAHLEIGQLRSAVEHENTIKQRTMADVTASESQWKHSHLKARDTITTLEKELAEHRISKDSIERLVQEQKSQMENLRAQLNSTEEVSHDFVRLSQNLQVRLAEMTAAQREVRWEHEDDVGTCRSCRKVFEHGTKKHHCRQCGKIYCNECSSKTVTKAPGSHPLRVCSSCYSTITTETPVVLPSDATSLETTVARQS